MKGGSSDVLGKMVLTKREIKVTRYVRAKRGQGTKWDDSGNGKTILTVIDNIKR
jgi:hypothetical protein